jgi:hypothetical protein
MTYADHFSSLSASAFSRIPRHENRPALVLRIIRRMGAVWGGEVEKGCTFAVVSQQSLES